MRASCPREVGVSRGAGEKAVFVQKSAAISLM